MPEFAFFFIVFGSKAVERKKGEGRFFCPECRREVEYDLMRVSRFFTLFWIPVFPMETLGEFVRCRGCNGSYDTSILALTQQQIEDAVSPWSCPFCGNSNAACAGECLKCRTPRGQGSAALPASSGGSSIPGLPPPA